MARQSIALTRVELCALVDFLSAILNDPDTLSSAGLTNAENDAVCRAHDKLVQQTLSRHPQAWGRVGPN